MPKPQLADVFGHWAKLFESFHTSSLDYYAKLQASLEQRKIPKAKVSRVAFSELGPGSAKRTYLRVQRDDIIVDVCAAPFGTGFFFSSWLIRKEPRPWPLIIGITLLGIGLAHLLHILPRWYYASLYYIGRALGPLEDVFSFLTQKGVYTGGLFIIGWLIWRWSRRVTYYTIDTMRMFQAAVHSAILEEIDGLTKAQGLRALTENERQPVMRQLLRE